MVLIELNACRCARWAAAREVIRGKRRGLHGTKFLAPALPPVGGRSAATIHRPQNAAMRGQPLRRRAFAGTSHRCAAAGASPGADGSASVPFAIVPGLDAVRGYEPLLANIRALLDIFASAAGSSPSNWHNCASRPACGPAFRRRTPSCFPALRQPWLDAMTSAKSDIRGLAHATLVVSCREDPCAAPLALARWIPIARHMATGRRSSTAPRFNRLVAISSPRPTRRPLEQKGPE